MAKDPAFLFYSKDWIEGTAELTPSEKGVYIDLLCYQHQKNDLPSDLNRLCRLVRLSYNEFIDIWNIISDKFIIDGDRMYNQKLSEVMTERSTKGKKNKVIGIFASLLRKADLDKKTYNEVRKSFNVTDFDNIDTERLTERLTEWFEERLKSIANEDANGNENIYDKINIDYVPKEFLESFNKWMNYKTQRKQIYKSDESKKAFLSKLIKLSKNNPKIAELIINESISNNWSGIFEYKGEIPKENPKGIKSIAEQMEDMRNA